MRYVLTFVGWVAAPFAAFAFVSTFAGTGGSDIQLILAGIYGMIFVTAPGGWTRSDGSSLSDTETREDPAQQIV